MNYTNYTVGAIDENVWIERVTQNEANVFTAIFTNDESKAFRFNTLTQATLCIFNVQTDDPCAAALNLIPIPVAPPARSIETDLFPYPF